MHLVGFIIRIYQDARSPESQFTRKDFYYAEFTSSDMLISPYIQSHAWITPRTEA